MAFQILVYLGSGFRGSLYRAYAYLRAVCTWRSLEIVASLPGSSELTAYLLLAPIRTPRFGGSINRAREYTLTKSCKVLSRLGAAQARQAIVACVYTRRGAIGVRTR